jgi:energy-coupling factor transport system permease protein
VAFAPQTIAALRSISEARRLRGRRSGWRAAPGLLLPLLLTSLERALQYGESLDARGYGSRRRSRYRIPPWHLADLLVAAASAASVVLTILLPVTGYNPYQEILPALPGVNGFATVLLLVLPAILVASPRTRHATDLV